MTAYEEIKNGCDDLGISISAICREQGVNRDLVQRWKNEDPKSIKIYKQLTTAIKEKKQQKSETC
jgi:transposase-like protein